MDCDSGVIWVITRRIGPQFGVVPPEFLSLTIPFVRLPLRSLAIYDACAYLLAKPAVKESSTPIHENVSLCGLTMKEFGLIPLWKVRRVRATAGDLLRYRETFEYYLNGLDRANVHSRGACNPTPLLTSPSRLAIHSKSSENYYIFMTALD
jgi:hypothetical protein